MRTEEEYKRVEAERDALKAELSAQKEWNATYEKVSKNVIEVLQAERDQNAINYGLEKADHDRTKAERNAFQDQCISLKHKAHIADGERDALEVRVQEMRSRCEKNETIAAAARNLIAQKGRHNTEIAYKRLEDAVAKERT